MDVLIEKIPGGFRIDGFELKSGKCGCTSVLPCCYSWTKVKRTGDSFQFTGKATGPETSENFTWSYTVAKGGVTVEVRMEDAADKVRFSGYYPPPAAQWAARGWEVRAQEGQRRDEALWRCAVCRWLYKEKEQPVGFAELSADWKCPACNAGRESFEKVG